MINAIVTQGVPKRVSRTAAYSERSSVEWSVVLIWLCFTVIGSKELMLPKQSFCRSPAFFCAWCLKRRFFLSSPWLIVLFTFTGDWLLWLHWLWFCNISMKAAALIVFSQPLIKSQFLSTQPQSWTKTCWDTATCFVERVIFSIFNFYISNPSPLFSVVTTCQCPRSVIQHWWKRGEGGLAICCTWNWLAQKTTTNCIISS